MHLRLRSAAILIPAVMLTSAAGPAAEPRDYPIQPVPFTAVRVDDDFWSPRLRTNREVTVGYCFDKCEETGRIANFEVAGGLRQGKFEGIYFNDSDVVKVIEGAAYTLASHPDPRLDAYLDGLIAKIAAAQEDDGYLYTARTIGDPNYDFPGRDTGRWSALGASHELYNVGHMYEAAVAHWQATGKRSLLDVALKNADLVCKVFGPGPGQRVDVPGHQEIEIGLVKLFRATGDEKYLRQAKFFIDMRGRKDKRERLYGEAAQDHLPLTDQREAVGHAVRGGYLYAGVADVAAITGDRDYIAAIDRIWQDVVGRKLYLIGSVGQHGAGEGYAGAYRLPNVEAYNETCAAIALALWNHRMFLLHGDAKYVDVLERILHNGFLAGVSLGGDRFFYPNPLACDMRFRFNHGALERSPWFGCSCCPVNVVRFIPSIPGYVCAVRGDALYLNLFIGGAAEVELGGGRVKVVQQTRYPWDGAVRVTLEPAQAREFALHVRVPGWLEAPLPGGLYHYLGGGRHEMRILVNGEPAEAARDRGFAVIRRTWQPGDTVELDIPLPVRRVLCSDKVEANRGRVAVERGPLVYCAEGADHAGRALDLFLADPVALVPEHRPDMLGGVTVLTGEAGRAVRADDGTVVGRPAGLTLIPYHAWCHRGANEMAVWLPRTRERAEAAPKPTLATTARASASHCWQADAPGAVNDGVEPQSSADQAVPRLTWWDHRGTTEWVQLDLAAPAEVSAVAVYWFDDTGRGECRVPAAARVLHRAGGEWLPVAAQGALGVAKDGYNQLRFTPVTTDALRLEVALRDGFSGGVLEWRVE